MLSNLTRGQLQREQKVEGYILEVL